jgi:hypothetical protein
MPSYTNSLRLVQPATGEYSGTWGTEVNNGITALVDASIAGTSNITMTAGNFTLTSNNGAADQSRAMFLVLGGTPGGSYQVICPAVSKLYFVTNNTGFAQTVKTASGSGVSVPNNKSIALRCDGTNVVSAQNYFGSLTLNEPLPVSSGGTGVTSIEPGGVVYGFNTSSYTTDSYFKFNGTNLCLGRTAPSTWGTNLRAIEVGVWAALVDDAAMPGQSGLMHNLHLFSGGTRFKVGVPSYAGAYLFSPGLGNHQWLTSSTVGTSGSFATMVQAMTLNASGNLGLGVTPSAWGGNQRAIEVGSFAGLVNDTTGNGLSGVMHNLVLNGGTYSFKLAASAYAGAYLFSPGTGGHQWLNSSAAGTGPATATMVQAMTLDTSGNLGLGNTPSASIAGTTIEVGVNKSGAFGALGNGPVDNAYVSANAYPTGSADPAFTSWKYTRTGFAAKYESGNGGAHRWYTAPSGTAGNAISFTQAMTLDASGNLGIGGTSPAARVHIFGPASSSANMIWQANAGTGTAYWISAKTSGLLAIGGNGSTEPASGALNIDNTGNLGIGTSSPSYRLQSVSSSAGGTTYAVVTDNAAGGAGVNVAGLGFANGGTLKSSITSAVYGNDYMAFNVGGSGTTERARITSEGNLLVGKTVAIGAGNTIFGTANPGVIHQNNNAAANGFVFTSYMRAGAEIGSVSQNGTTAVLYNTTSDRRLKDNIVPAPSASDVIDAIQIVSHDWKAAPDEHVTYGVIAQDLHAVVPQAVLQGDDGEEVEKTWGVDYSKLVPMLIKEIQQLRARVAALEQA